MSSSSMTKSSTRTYQSSADSGPGINYNPTTKSKTSMSSYRSGSGPMTVPMGSSNVTRTTTISYGSKAGMDSGNAGALAEAGAKQIQESRTNEKKSMQDLNSRFANYIEKNRFLEAQLKSVEQRLKDLQDKWGKETEVVKQMYESELREAKDLYNDSEKEKARIELKIQSLEDQVAEYRRKLDDMERLRAQDKDTINRQNQQLADYESELNMLRRRVNGLEQDLAYEKGEHQRLQDELFKTIQERDAERLNNIELQNQMQALQEEMEFLKNLHDQEMKEMQALIGQDSYKDNRKFWEGEMSNAIRELQNEFDRRLDHQNQQMQSYYQMKVQEVKSGQAKDQNKVENLMTETKRMSSMMNDLRSQIGDLENRNMLLEKQYNDLLRQHEEEMRTWDQEKTKYESEIERLTSELERMLREMEVVMDSKLSLELEIAAYRKLLEVEENRMNMRETVGGMETVTETMTQQSLSSQMMRDGGVKLGGGSSNAITAGSMSQKTTFQRSAKGPLAISQVDPTGLWVEVENTGRKEESIDGWKIVRKVDNKIMPSFEFPEGFILGNTRDNRSIKVYAQGKGPVGCLEYAMDNWGSGSQVTTSLVNPAGEDKAMHVQKTSYAQ
ncbi:intermediate filament protein A-like [Watersipora subatra]|uniref:intermediate filament protein A-like n=1 Tax=Watersipora subatra TaxID=2589382 RepID=UPI00355B6F29